MPLPNDHLDREHSLSELLQSWAYQDTSLGDLLTLHSSERDPVEPPWVSLCEQLTLPNMDGWASLAADRDHRALNQLREQLWGESAGSATELVSALFHDDGFATIVPLETRLRAIAIAECAREAFDFQSRRKKPWDNPVDAALHPLERVLLLRHWSRADNRLKRDDASLLTVMLVNDHAPKDVRGRLCRLRLWKVDLSGVPGGAAWHGAVVRAPAAMLLTLKGHDPRTGEMDDSFERALRKVEAVLKASLAPPEEAGKGACALAWSLQPVEMNRERADGVTQGIFWGMDFVSGGSATLPFALGALVLLRHAVKPEWLTLREHLRAIEPAQLAMSAAFAGDVLPQGLDPLDWPLEPIGGLGDKLGAFVQDGLQQSKASSRAQLILVAEGQTGVPANTVLKVEYPATLRRAVEIAARHAQSPLPDAVQSVLDFLLGEARRLNPFLASDTPLSPPLTPAQLYDLRSAEPAHDWPSGGDRAVQWHLLQRYAVWAGGEHQLWGAPARLAKDFAPILLKPQARHNVAHGHGETTAGEFKEREQANSLYDLLRAGSHEDRNNFRQPRVWVLTAPPAAGKSTLLAEFEMHMAWRALCQFAGGASEHFGEVPLWVPASGLELKNRDKEGNALPPLPLRQALADWVRQHRPELGEWPDLLHAKNLRIRLMLDGVNELDCDSQERQQLLGRWLDQDYPPDHRHLPPLITVRSLEQSFVFDGDRQAELVPWNKEQREHYIHQRFQGHPEQLAAMHAAVTQDADSADDDPTHMLYSSPGMLALGCTLTEQNLLPLQALDAAPGQTVNRARLLATYVWSVLRRERGKPHLPADLLGPEELERLPRLEQDLQGDCWAPPEAPGSLLAALREQAWAMQPRVQLPEIQWFAQHKDRRALLAAADHLSLVGSVDAGSVRGRKQVEHRWRHHLLMEWFAAYGLSPDDLPPEAAAPAMDDEQTLFRSWLDARNDWLEMRAEQRRSRSTEKTDAEGHGVGRGEDEDDDEQADERALPTELKRFRLPTARVSVLEEPIKLAAQLRGNVEDWVSELIDIGNVPLAARLALENWAAFGEPRYPQADPLAPWRESTHPILKELREALHERMYSKASRLSQRIEAGDLLGQIGGSPLYEICGKALVLKDSHWVLIGAPSEAISFDMGDLEGDEDERTNDGRLYKVKNLPAFLMAGYLVTNAQYRCFFQSGEYRDPVWWPKAARRWLLNASAEEQSPWSIRQMNAFEFGLAPVTCNFWQAQAYARWECAQRQCLPSSPNSLGLPSEAQWEGAARWAVAQRGSLWPQRWRFAHTPGLGAPYEESELDNPGEAEGFADVPPWNFNHDDVLGWRSSPVGVFLDSHSRSEGGVLTDLAGNVREWCDSALRTSGGAPRLGAQVTEKALGHELRPLRGGSYDDLASRCRVGFRARSAPVVSSSNSGFRLVSTV